MPEITKVIERGLVRVLFQPIVELASGRVVAHEALARGPEGTELESPLALFEAARTEGVVAELDWACRIAALRRATDAGLRRPTRLFVNVAADAVDSPPPEAERPFVVRALAELDVVFEITEQVITARPAEMLVTSDRLRELGAAIALDDVGADPRSLALVPFISPEVVKLDLRLVQQRPSVGIAEIANAVSAEAERGHTAVVAEGIETPEHVEIARALGADYGQGWLFGRPGPDLQRGGAAGMRLHARRAFPPRDKRTPFEVVTEERELRRGDKALLLTISRQLERQAELQGGSAVVLAAFQEARHFTTGTARRYAALGRELAFVGALARDLDAEPAPCVRGARIDADDDVLHREWIVTVTSPHFAAAFTARDLGGEGIHDMSRRFDFALTYDRDLAVRAARALMREVAPRGPAA